MTGDNIASARWRLTVDILAVVSALSLLLTGWALYDRFDQGNQARQDNKRVWHAVICALETATAHNTKVDVTSRKLAIKFYDQLLTEDVQTTGCGIAVDGG